LTGQDFGRIDTTRLVENFVGQLKKLLLSDGEKKEHQTLYKQNRLALMASIQEGDVLVRCETLKHGMV
jgi:hypothetical protein